MPAAAVRALPSELRSSMQSADFTQNYFELFGMIPAFDLDAGSLQSAQRRLQSIYHPDRHVGADDRARRLSVQMAARVNEAYETLRDPVKRSRYLLEISGAEMADASKTTSDTAFLMEQIELREALDACRQASDGLSRCDEIESRLSARADELAREFVSFFEQGELDVAQDRSRKMQFIQRIQAQLSELRFELEGV